MTRISKLAAAALALVVLAAPALMTAGTASAAPWTGTRAQAIQYVIQRALSQRGVPYSYGGGNVDGASLGSGSGDDSAPAAPVDLSAAQATDPLSPAPLLPGLGLPAPVAAPVAPAPKPKVVGFDSSGLIVYAFAGVGIKMPRSSGEQYKVGRKVLPSQALPGDLIFWGPDGSQSVALFIGNGQMVESTPPAVTVSKVRTDGMTPYLVRVIDQ